MLLEEQTKTSNYEALVQEKHFLEQKFEMIRDELMAEKARDTEIQLDAKVREMQRKLQGKVYIV